MTNQLQDVAVVRNTKATSKKNIAKGIVELKKNSYIWRQTHFNSEGTLETVNIQMKDMSNEHLIKAGIKCQKKIIEAQKQILGWNDLLEKLNETCDERGIEIPCVSRIY